MSYIIFIVENSGSTFLRKVLKHHQAPNLVLNLNYMKIHSLSNLREKKIQKKKKMFLLAKLKNLTEVCYNIKVKEEQAFDAITSLVDEALLVARGKLETESEGLVERNSETLHVKQTGSTTKDYLVKSVLPLSGN